MSYEPHPATHAIQTRFSVTQGRFGSELVWSTTYTGTREALLRACIVVEAQFPQLTKARSSANGAHAESGRWYLWQENPLDDVWSITYYAPGFLDELDQDQLRRLQRHLLQVLQITPETIGAIVLEWRKHAARQNP